MDIDWGTVAGVIVGALTTLGVWKIQSREQRRWQNEDFERQQRATRDQEVRVRADLKAQEAVDAIDDLERLLVAKFRVTAHLWPNDKDDRRAAKDALQRLSQAALYIPQPLRTHLELAVSVLNDADRLGSEGWHRDSPWNIGSTMLQVCRRSVGRFLRNEALTIELSSKEAEYEQALARLDEYREHELERAIEAEVARVAAEEEPGDP